MKEALKHVIRVVTPPLIRRKPISEWPGWLGRVHGVKVPRAQPVKEHPDPTGNANIEILCQMIERTRHLPGSIADCGVFQGGSTVGMALYMREHGITKLIYALDSFEGFDPKDVEKDLALGGVENEDRHLHGFNATSVEAVERKMKRFGLGNVILVKGYFCDSLPRLPLATEFSFVHIDVNLESSYRDCLKHFYRQTVQGGIILFDEYNDPPWPGCNKAVDEFLAGKPERLEMVEWKNYQKWYFVKSSITTGTTH
jgi:O-methyltransferase